MVIEILGMSVSGGMLVTLVVVGCGGLLVLALSIACKFNPSLADRLNALLHHEIFG